MFKIKLIPNHSYIGKTLITRYGEEFKILGKFDSPDIDEFTIEKVKGAPHQTLTYSLKSILRGIGEGKYTWKEEG